MRYNSNSNPVMSDKFFSNISGNNVMTYEGAMQKIGILLGFTVISALITSAYSLTALANGNIELLSALAMGGVICGFILVLVIYMTRPKNPAPLMITYAIVEGVFIGAMSTVMEYFFPGIVIQAIIGTLAIFVSMYFLYTIRVLRATPTFNKVVSSLTASIMLLYVISFVISFATPYEMPLLHSSSLMGIGLTVFILVVAALNLIMDFGFIERSVQNQTPKVGEWWGAFGMLITLIWIYIEVLRLLMKLRSRN
ncbi:MAG: Bax inhibitor-1/YccA family protein [Candidatus Poseidoniaceae archaeon]|nr:Bax inhibitor-1/YccA family protein [Candidatus Poseidoniaceae archaeon]